MNEHLAAILEKGQSIWYDNIRRALLNSGDLKALIDQGVRGVTSNPSIFEKAIAGSTDYDDELREMADSGYGTEAIFERLALEDISRAAALLEDVYQSSDGVDGYASLEVSPQLADDTDGTIEEAIHLYESLERPNVMIKVPATEAGLPAIEHLTSKGVNVNVTLIFSRARYQKVMEAYLQGLEKLVAEGGNPQRVVSVASFFISRVDVALAPKLEQAGLAELKGEIGIANAKLAYQQFKDFFQGERWQRLAEQGAKVQRPLWASTSTKDPSYPETMYVEALIGQDTVNTVPPATLRAVMDEVQLKAKLQTELDRASEQIERLTRAGIDLDAITEQLEHEGVEGFANAYQRLLDSIDKKISRLKEERPPLEMALGEYEDRVERSIDQVAQAKVIDRIWQNDHTVWRPEPEEITNRLGWLTIPARMQGVTDELDEFAQSLYEQGLRRVILLGMGGSSLAPEVFRESFGVAEGRLDLEVLDSTDPEAVLNLRGSLDISETLFIVATKSGTTVETLSFFKYFYNEVVEALGEELAGDHFIGITDPGSKLVELADHVGFRRVFINDPNIGGRYSALSYFGLVPAALVGVDLDELLERALTAASGCEDCVPCRHNPAARLGAAMAELAEAGRDKLTFVLADEYEHFGDWVEQLIAESTGKDGKGILPVVGEPLGEPSEYGPDRVFVQLRMPGQKQQEEALAALKEAGHPLIRFNVTDVYDMGGQMFIWEMATAIAGERLEIHPFNQPNVESAKKRARQMVEAYQDEGELPEEAPVWQSGQLSVFWGSPQEGQAPDIDGLTGAIEALLAQAEPESYLSLHAYLTPSMKTTEQLRQIQARLRDQTNRAVTVGYGPRFLHSTGQLHKGDSGHGLFLQLTKTPGAELPIPEQAGSEESELSFGVLVQAQASGDRQALAEAGRTVMRLDLGDDQESGLKELLSAVGMD